MIILISLRISICTSTIFWSRNGVTCFFFARLRFDETFLWSNEVCKHLTFFIFLTIFLTILGRIKYFICIHVWARKFFYVVTNIAIIFHKATWNNMNQGLYHGILRLNLFLNLMRNSYRSLNNYLHIYRLTGNVRECILFQNFHSFCNEQFYLHHYL